MHLKYFFILTTFIMVFSSCDPHSESSALLHEAQNIIKEYRNSSNQEALLDSAHAILDHAIELNSENIGAWELKSWVSFQQKSSADFIASTNKVLSYYHGDPQAHANAANAFLMLGDEATGLSHLDTALTLFEQNTLEYPNDQQLKVGYFNTLVSAGKFTQADAFVRAQRSKPSPGLINVIATGGAERLVQSIVSGKAHWQGVEVNETLPPVIPHFPVIFLKDESSPFESDELVRYLQFGALSDRGPYMQYIEVEQEISEKTLQILSNKGFSSIYFVVDSLTFAYPEPALLCKNSKVSEELSFQIRVSVQDMAKLEQAISMGQLSWDELVLMVGNDGVISI
ncbi:MAG: hypothetical protein MK081_04060 [Flavobacteriales bacterium]|nr:hypothetical protein [Flavobacteriales bacterium]